MTHTDRYITPSQIKEIVGIGRTTVLKLEAAGQFPRRRVLSSGQTAWLESELLLWMRSRPQVIRFIK